MRDPRFQNPISNGQHIDSTKTDIRKMKRQSHVLHKLLLGFVQRKDQRLLGDMLPPKSVYVISVRLSPLQRRLYQRLLAAIPHKQGKSRKNYLFQAYQALTKVRASVILLIFGLFLYTNLNLVGDFMRSTLDAIHLPKIHELCSSLCDSI